ncbi:MAG: hypothetical protein ACI4TF_02300 [Oliverpabstia sp.]
MQPIRLTTVPIVWWESFFGKGIAESKKKILASGYLKVLSYESYGDVPEGKLTKYELTLINLEVKLMFFNMVRGWFRDSQLNYNDFVQALLLDNLDAMNDYMNRVAMSSFSYFDTGKRTNGEEPERFYHGGRLGLMVDLQDRYTITSNRESGFGRYDVGRADCKGNFKRAYLKLRVCV